MLRESVNLTPGPIPHIKQDMMYPQMASPGPPPSRQVDKPVEELRLVSLFHTASCVNVYLKAVGSHE